MEKLGCSETEALDIIACDKAIDKGEKMDFDLSKEQQKICGETCTEKVLWE